MQKQLLSMRTFLPIAAILILLSVAGCGDRDSSSAGAVGEDITVKSSMLSKKRFIRLTDELCQRNTASFFAQYLRAKGGKTSPQSEKTQARRLVDGILVPVYGDLIARIRALGAPSGDVDQVSDFVTVLQQELDEAQERPVEAVRELPPFARTARLADAYGLLRCGNSLD